MSSGLTGFNGIKFLLTKNYVNEQVWFLKELTFFI